MKRLLDYRLFYRRSLPHYQPQSGIFFITYRLHFDLPPDFRDKIKNRRIQLASKKQFQPDELDKILFDGFDNYLALCNTSPKYLSEPKIAKIVMQSLDKMANKQYKLYCYCIMPNHVHILIQPLVKQKGRYFSLAEIMRGHKGATANRINKILHKQEHIWHGESYDHHVRSQEEFDRILFYIINNPVKAGLVKNYSDWPYLWIDNEILSSRNFLK